MTFSIRISQQASGDIREARDWYEEQVSGLGEEFGRELDIVLRRFGNKPEMYPIVYRNVRRALTRRFPYAIYFVIEADRVSVLRVLHQARDPKEWRKNMKNESTRNRVDSLDKEIDFKNARPNPRLLASAAFRLGVNCEGPYVFSKDRSRSTSARRSARSSVSRRISRSTPSTFSSMRRNFAT